MITNNFFMLIIMKDHFLQKRPFEAISVIHNLPSNFKKEIDASLLF